MVSCLPSAMATLSLVPTPSVEATSTGNGYGPVSSRKRLPKPPIPPSTAGVAVEAAACPISSTARRASSMSTPASR